MFENSNVNSKHVISKFEPRALVMMVNSNLGAFAMKSRKAFYTFHHYSRVQSAIGNLSLDPELVNFYRIFPRFFLR